MLAIVVVITASVASVAVFAFHWGSSSGNPKAPAGLGGSLSRPGSFPSYLDGPNRTDNASAVGGLLNDTNVASLHPLWNFSTGGVIASQPIVVDGIVYFGSWDGYEYAVSASSGALLWKTFLGIDTADTPCNIPLGVTSTAAYQDGNLYVNGGTPTLFVLNSSTGAINWSVPLGGTAAQGFYLWSSPLVADGSVYEGISSDCDIPLVPAGVARVTLQNHTVEDYFDSSAPNPNGSSIWGSPSWNATSQTVFVTTGNAFQRLASTYDDSLVALDASTLSVKATWQVPLSEQSPDGDFGSTPVLINEKGAPATVAAINKNGMLYDWYQSNLTLRWEHRISIQTYDVVANVAFGGGRIYAIGPSTVFEGATYNASVRAIDPQSGATLWEAGLPDYNPGYGAPLYVHGVVFVPDGTTLFALDSGTGRLLTSITPSANKLFGPVSCADSELFAAWGSNLTAFDLNLSVRATATALLPGSSPGTVGFQVHTTGGLPPYVVNWSFGDGGATTSLAPDHSYKGPGIYNVSVRLTDRAGTVAVTNLTVVVPTVPAGWTQRSPPVAPAPRADAMMAYDPADGYVVLFGGVSSEGTALGDTWTYRGGIWTDITGALTRSPPPRFGGTLTYDAADGYLVLFGGQGLTSHGPGLLGDTWTFRGGVWTPLPTTGGAGPSARGFAAATYDAVDGYVLLFGGQTASGWQSDSWEFVHGNWTRASTGVSPASPVEPEMAYDPLDGQVVLYGGSGSSISTWEFSGGQWAQPATSGTPPPAFAGSGVDFDSGNGYLLQFGGSNGASVLSDRTFDFVGGSWSGLSPRVAPSPRTEPSMVYDAADGYTLLFGGHTGPMPFEASGETWTWQETYPVSFTESGLPSGSRWYLNLSSGSSLSAPGTTPKLTVDLPIGTYAVSVGTNDSRYAPSYSTGLEVNGTPVVTSVVFHPVTYPVRFSERGLPAGQTWEVTFAGTLRATTTDGRTDSVSFPDASNGTFPYRIGSLVGWQQSSVPYSGATRVNGSALGVQLTYGQYAYPLTFYEYGLPANKMWMVTIDRVTEFSSNGTMTFYEGNGTLAYTVGVTPGGNANGSVTLNGTPAEVDLVYSDVTFLETGLPSGTNWSVTTNNVTQNASTYNQHYFLLNGSYAYQIGAVPGYVTVSSGTFTVNGTTLVLDVPFYPVQTNLTAPTVSATALDADQSLAVTEPVALAGVPPFSWQWLISVNGGAYAPATVCTVANGTGASEGAMLTCQVPGGTLTGGTAYAFELEVTDNATPPGTQTSPASGTVEVSSMLLAPAEPSVSAHNLDVDQPLTLTGVLPSTGTAPYAWQWLLALNGSSYAPVTGCPTPAGTGGPPGGTVVCSIPANSLTVGGQYTFKLHATDNATVPETNTSIANWTDVYPALTVPSAPSVSATALPSNQSLTVTGKIPSTGTSPYAWEWLVSVNGGTYVPASACAIGSGTAASAGTTVTCVIAGGTLTIGDTYAFELVVRDSASASETETSAPSATVTVSAA